MDLREIVRVLLKSCHWPLIRQRLEREQNLFPDESADVNMMLVWREKVKTFHRLQQDPRPSPMKSIE